MNTTQVKHRSQRRNRKLIVTNGRIVDPALRIACDPLWLAWLRSGAPTANYVPFQNVQPHECVSAEYREDWIGA